MEGKRPHGVRNHRCIGLFHYLLKPSSCEELHYQLWFRCEEAIDNPFISASAAATRQPLILLPAIYSMAYDGYTQVATDWAGHVTYWAAYNHSAQTLSKSVYILSQQDWPIAKADAARLCKQSVNSLDSVGYLFTYRQLQGSFSLHTR